ncbi:hypothetical protein [Deinococcus alpinitundrae]|uniref:hypothetical protein n=1 Tax=Deinococcus alpinitundrae TaxID=468913 RepID=UPI00137B754D|nr:hypothetical protein [Deinococcus alpinitundrae]
MNHRTILPLLCLLPLLSSCQSTKTTPINFNTDPQILRGHWTGTITLNDGQTKNLALDLVPNYYSEHAYTVAGTGNFDAVPVTVAGVASALSGKRFIHPQTSPILFDISLNLTDDQTRALIECRAFESTGQLSTWNCRFSSLKISSFFKLQQSKL